MPFISFHVHFLLVIKIIQEYINLIWNAFTVSIICRLDCCLLQTRIRISWTGFTIVTTPAGRVHVFAIWDICFCSVDVFVVLQKLRLFWSAAVVDLVLTMGELHAEYGGQHVKYKISKPPRHFFKGIVMIATKNQARYNQTACHLQEDCKKVFPNQRRRFWCWWDAFVVQ